MIRVFARSASRSLIIGRSFNSHISMAAFPDNRACTTMAMRIMMMSTASSSTPEDNPKETPKSVSEAKKGESNLMVSSYWGISRPMIKRKDGTDWPWNCFLVRLACFLSFFFFPFCSFLGIEFWFLDLAAMGDLYRRLIGGSEQTSCAEDIH